MDRHARTTLTASLLLGLGAAGACSLPGTAAAQRMIDGTVYALHGTGPFRAATGSAIVTRLAGDRFHLTLTAAHLPPPTILHARLARHAYVAWLVNGATMRGPLHMAAMGLVGTGGTGIYAGQGTVTIDGVTSVIVTAEPAAQACMPILPALTVLGSAGYQR